MTDTQPVPANHPSTSPYAEGEADCIDPECDRPAHTHIVVIDNGEEHRAPLCKDHLLQYSQPGWLRKLRQFVGLGREEDATPHDPDAHVEPPYDPAVEHGEPELRPMEAPNLKQPPQQVPAPGPTGMIPAPEQVEKDQRRGSTVGETVSEDQLASEQPESQTEQEAPAEGEQDQPEEEAVEPSSSADPGPDAVQPGPEVI